MARGTYLTFFVTGVVHTLVIHLSGHPGAQSVVTPVEETTDTWGASVDRGLFYTRLRVYISDIPHRVDYMKSGDSPECHPGGETDVTSIEVLLVVGHTLAPNLGQIFTPWVPTRCGGRAFAFSPTTLASKFVTLLGPSKLRLAIIAKAATIVAFATHHLGVPTVQPLPYHYMRMFAHTTSPRPVGSDINLFVPFKVNFSRHLGTALYIGSTVPYMCNGSIIFFSSHFTSLGDHQLGGQLRCLQ